MKKIIALFLFAVSTIFPQYVIQSEYLKEPEKMIGFADSCAAFWTKAWDNDGTGGFFTNIGKTGNVNSSWGRNKDMQTQSRNAYGLIRAFQMTGNEEYLELADKALRFMYDNAWDNEHEGWFWSMDESGNPINTHGRKEAFHQHYGMLGISAMCEATADTFHKGWLDKSYNMLVTKLWETSCTCSGYYDNVSYDWSDKQGKSFNATVDALTTHLLSMFEMTGDTTYYRQMLMVTSNIKDHLVPSMDKQAVGFFEEYDQFWNVDDKETLTLMGHVLKTAWCLGRVYRFYPDENYIPAAEKLIDDVLDNGGYDFEFGGPYKDFDRVTGEMQMWNNPDTAKAWWQMEQAITAGLEIYDLTGNDKYLQMADESLDFFMTHFVDPVYGEVYENRTRYGGETWGEHKGNGNKAGYHSIETAWYVYLYGNLFYHKKPVDIYYSFEAADSARSLKLTPLAIEDNKLTLAAVKLDGTEYAAFEPETRTLEIPAGTGGKFLVTFLPEGATGIEDQIEAPVSFALNQNYPNPFNPTTRISYSLDEQGPVTLKVYDILGREVATLVNGVQPAGGHTVNFNASGLSSGVYLYSISFNGERITRKMSLLK